MAAETPDWNIDISDDQLAGLYVRADSDEAAPTPRFAEETALKRRIRLLTKRGVGLEQLWETVALAGSGFEVAVGAIDLAPTGGSFALNYNGSTTGLTTLGYDITAAALETALNANAAVTLDGGLDVTQTGQLYIITFRTFGAKTLLTADASNLLPTGTVIVSRPTTGDADTYEVQTLEVIQQPYAYSDSWAEVTDGTVAPTTLFTGSDEKPASYKVSFSEPPIRGAVRVNHQVQQISKITVGVGNTATKHRWYVTLQHPLTQGYSLDLGGASDAQRRFWFDIDGAGTGAPAAPTGGTLVEVDILSSDTQAEVIAKFIAVADAHADFIASGQSNTIARVTAVDGGVRTSSVGNAAALIQDAIVGTDGRLAGKYFTLTNRLGSVCWYFTAGVTTSVPDVEADDFQPIAVAIDASAATVASTIGSAIDAHDEFSASTASNVVTVTDAYGGERDSYAEPGNNSQIGVSVSRAGSSVSAGIPWESDATTISDLLGDEFTVSTPDKLTWILTRNIRGAMPDLTATDESLVWPSRVEGTLDFDTLALKSVFAATTDTEIDALLEVWWTPPGGGSRRVILQILCRIAKVMLKAAGMSTPAFASPLTGVSVANTLFVHKGGNDATAQRGRLDKAYVTIAAAKADAISGDVIVVFRGTYDENDLMKDGVTLHFIDAAVTYTGSSTTAIFDDNNTAMTSRISGNGRFTNSKATGVAPVLRLRHASSNATLEADYASATYYVLLLEEGYSHCEVKHLVGTTADGAGIVVSGGEHYYDGQHVDTAYDGIIMAAGILHSNIALIEAVGNVLEMTGGAIWHKGHRMVSSADVALNIDAGSLFIDVQSIESTGAFGAGELEFCNGTIEAALIQGGSAGAALTLGNETDMIFKGCRIKAGATTLKAIDITGIITGLTLWNCLLVAGATATNAIIAASPTNVRAMGSWANLDPDADITITTAGGLTVDSNVA